MILLTLGVWTLALATIIQAYYYIKRLDQSATYAANEKILRDNYETATQEIARLRRLLGEKA